MIRASGTLADPNKLGAVTAFWTIGAVVLARRMPRPWSTVVTLSALAIGIGAVWLCGSRTGLAAVVVSVVIAAWEGVRALAVDASVSRASTSSASLVIGAAAVVLAVAMIVAAAETPRRTPSSRAARWTYMPFYGDKGITESVNELLWERFGYGPAAIEMIKEHPIDGIGVGMFHALSTDFGKVAGYTIPQPDNAQNWFRHHLAELGLVGSIPLLWWCWICGALMFSRHRGGDRLSIGLLRGVLIGFAVASMFGMPAQSIAIVITFWVVCVLAVAGTNAGRVRRRRQLEWPKISGDRRRGVDRRSCRHDDRGRVRRSSSARTRAAMGLVLPLRLLYQRQDGTISNPIRAATRLGAAGR